MYAKSFKIYGSELKATALALENLLNANLLAGGKQTALFHSVYDTINRYAAKGNDFETIYLSKMTLEVMVSALSYRLTTLLVNCIDDCYYQDYFDRYNTMIARLQKLSREVD